MLSEGCDITYRCHACAWNCRAIEPNGFGPTYESPKKETIRMDGFLWYPNTIDQLLTHTGILRRLRRLRVASAFVLTAGQNQRHCIPLPCLRMELPGDRTQWVRSDIRITKKETIRMDGFFFGDPYGNRTHITAVKGRCLNLLTNGPGSGNLTRTDDTPGMNRMLYQLSYAAIFLLCLTARDIISAKKRFVNNFCSVFSRFQKVFSASSTNSPKTPSRQRPATRTRRI